MNTKQRFPIVLRGNGCECRACEANREESIRARAEVARLTAALTRSEEARRVAEEHADRVERLGQIAVDNARDRAVAAEAKVEAGLDLARTWDQGTECNEVGCRNSFHSAARALRAALGNKK
jgi:hypothetical protein